MADETNTPPEPPPDPRLLPADMKWEQVQQFAQFVCDTILSSLLETQARVGGRYFRQPVRRVYVDGAFAVFRVDDWANPELWVEIPITARELAGCLFTMWADAQEQAKDPRSPAY